MLQKVQTTYTPNARADARVDARLGAKSIDPLLDVDTTKHLQQDKDYRNGSAWASAMTQT